MNEKFLSVGGRTIKISQDAPQGMTPKECAELILQKRREIDRLYYEIDKIAKEYIDDFHFLDYSVSTFWSCEKSPIGMCLFNLNDRGRKTDCRYCGGPVERK